MGAEKLRMLRRVWVEGPPPMSHRRAVEAQLVISDLIAECFRLRLTLQQLRQEQEGRS